MTDQRYLVDSDVRTFEATVTRRLDDRLALDGTHFYPTGGGQPHDTGTLEANGDTWRVVDVQKSDVVYHTVEPADGTESDGEGPAEGTTVTGRLDWDRRWAHMRYHTAQHLLSAILLEEFDAQTTGNQVYHDHAHLDAAYDRFSAEDLETIETRLNELVDDDRAVTWYTMAREEAEATLDTDRTRIDLLPDSITELRIVEIEGADSDSPSTDSPSTDSPSTDSPIADSPFDRTACAGTHVTSTDDIGELVVTGRETKGAEEERIEFVLAEHQ